MRVVGVSPFTCARPKSMSLTSPSVLISTLSVLTSPCTMSMHELHHEVRHQAVLAVREHARQARMCDDATGDAFIAEPALRVVLVEHLAVRHLDRDALAIARAHALVNRAHPARAEP